MDRVVRVYIVLSASCRVLLVSDFVVLITQYGDINYRYIVIYDSAIFRPALDNVTKYFANLRYFCINIYLLSGFG